MLKRFLIFSLLVVGALASFIPAPVLAAEKACTCFCGNETNGANPISGKFTLSDDCRTACDTAKLDYISCATEADQFPVANALCFTDAECKVVKNTDGAAAIWGDTQPAECPGPIASGTDKSDAYHYCYAAPRTATLNVSIGNQTKTLPIGDYINLLYTYSLSIAAIIAVVMIMVGGAQYIIGSSSGGEAVTAARTRITNAVTGLVLLLFAYLVLNTVNPALVKFKVLKLPLVKPSLFLTGSCEDFDAQKYKINPEITAAKTSCGDKGEITKDPTGQSLSDTDCIFDDCGSSDKLCGQTGKEYKCMSCKEAGSSEFLDAGFAASDAHCKSLSPAPTPTRKDRCVYGGTIGTLEGAFTSYAKGQKYCTDLQVSCNLVSSCADYGNVSVNTGLVASGGGVQAYVDGSKYTPDEDSAEIKAAVKTLCEEDPCGVAPVPSTCIFDASLQSFGNNVTYPFACR